MTNIGFQKGQPVIAVFPREARRGQPSPPAHVVPCQVSTVGRTWITLSYPERRSYRFDPATMEIEDRDGGVVGRVYLSEAEYRGDEERQRLWQAIAQRFRQFGGRRAPTHLDIEATRLFIETLQRAEALEDE